MKRFKLFNSIFGWVAFAISAFVYLSTIEPTASFWDCGEFISTAFKLQVGHPPGAPLFMIIGRFFTLFTSDPGKVAIMVNAMSAIFSALTILFLFWSITHLAKKLIIKDDNYNLGNTIAIIGAGLVGALAYTFSDTFWFSAVEGEVYASSSFFTAIVFWAILKWEDKADEKHSNRWLVLIAYLMGLSIGVHLLNLLAIPAIVFVYYFKKYDVTRAGLIKASLVSIALLGIVMYIIIQGLVVIASKFELLFVNGFGLPFSSGAIFYSLLIITGIIWGLIYTYQKGKVLLNTILLCVTVIIIGYSSVAMIVIRSSADTPLDENDPDNMFSLLAYINREQYGDRPLVYGQTYNAPVLRSEEGSEVYTPMDGEYKVTNHKVEYVYDERFLTFFPRMYSNDPDHVKAYKRWANVKGKPYSIETNNGESKKEYKPTFGENLKFFFKYQVGHMYLRYFMWNFAGRQNDIQGHGEPTKGNWLSGIKFIDEMRLGDQDNQPDYITKNKGHNIYYCLPLLLGLIGLIYQFRKKKRDFTVVMLLFFFTGLAIVMYLNQKPYEPRERDYAYAGSFYAFAIWIGLGIIALYEFLSTKVPRVLRATAVTGICLVAVPGLMATENWDDHDRSGRYTCRDFAYNYLNSCAPNAILFTNGDNDTFPLWYAQEVEGIRTDVRVVNLSYLSADWYVEQMERKVYQSDPLPFKLTREDVLQGKRDIIFLVEREKGKYQDLAEAMEVVSSEDPSTKRLNYSDERVDYIPAKYFSLKIDTADVLKSGTVSREMASKIVPEMKWSINRNYITKADLMILDLLLHNKWQRPVYFAITVSHDNYLNLDNYMQINGLTYRIVPVRSEAPQGDISAIDTKLVYDNLMNKFKWGGIENPKVYLDENNQRMLMNFRNSFSKLAEGLINEGKKDSALKVLDKCMELMPESRVSFNYFVIPIAVQYYRINKTEKANAIISSVINMYTKELDYFSRLKRDDLKVLDLDIRIGLSVMQQVTQLTNQFGQAELSRKAGETFQNYFSLYQGDNNENN